MSSLYLKEKRSIYSDIFNSCEACMYYGSNVSEDFSFFFLKEMCIFIQQGCI